MTLPLPAAIKVTLPLPAAQTAEWRSMAAGQDILVVDPSDPGYSPKGTYYVSVTRCVCVCVYQVRFPVGVLVVY